ncbi:MAG: glycosyl hydrolase 2 galactose-binding domain-containing protein [Armatimonadota bacterium]
MSNLADSAQIAADHLAATALPTRPAMRPRLGIIAPRQLPQRTLESEIDAGIPLPTPQEKLESEAQFAARLAELRTAYEPFLQNFTPSNPLPRVRHEMTAFHFRLEEPADLADATRPYSPDEGAWEDVNLPDFRGPAGRWAGYYRTTFTPQNGLLAQGRVWLVCRGVDYACQVFLNGRFIGAHEGLFAPFAFDVTEAIHAEGENTLLLRVENDVLCMGNNTWDSGTDLDGDKLGASTGPGWDEPGNGWHHCPPGAGIWQPVYLESRPATAIHDLFVRPDIDNERIELWLEVFHTGLSRVPVRAEISIYPRNFDGNAVEGISITLAPAGPRLNEYRIPLHLSSFLRWTPETPCLYTLRVRLLAAEGTTQAVDLREVTFGMRKFHQDEAQIPKGTLYLNNREIILRGANTMGNLQCAALAGNRQQVIDDILIAKMANLNFIRLTQRPVQQEIYELCDALGMLLQTDLPLLGTLRKSKVEEAARQAGEMERLIRRHPSNILVSFINEPLPIAAKPEMAHRGVNREELENFFDIAAHLVHLYNPDRVIKCCDGDYEPPARHGMPDQHCYCTWYANHGVPLGLLHAGYLFPLKPDWKGGCGEYGAEGLDPWETMAKHYPKDWLPADPDAPWTPEKIPMSQTWRWQHQWFDKQDTAAEWIVETQMYQAWAIHFQTMALRRRADLLVSTAVHLLIDAHPAGWLKALVSADRIPKPAYFALADALTPLAVNLRTDCLAAFAGDLLDMELWVLNDLPSAPEGLSLVYWVRQGNQTLFSQQTSARVSRCDAAFQGRFNWKTPQVTKRTRLEVGVALVDPAGRVLHDHTITIEVFPRTKHGLLRGRKVGIVGTYRGIAWQLAEKMGAVPILFEAHTLWDLVISDSPSAAEAVSSHLGKYLETGGRALFLECEAPRTWRIAGREVQVVPLVPYHFASRRTDHPAMAKMKPFDLFLWYNPLHGVIDHVVKSGLVGNGLLPITLTGKGAWESERMEIPASAELRIGNGRAIFNQVLATPLYDAEPRAALYLESLLGYLLGE